MASTGQQQNSGKDPWRNTQEEGPPDLAHLFKKIFGKFSQTSSRSEVHARLSAVRVAGWVIIAVIAIWAMAGVFLVSPAEQAVVLRFGKYVETVGPGPHWIPPLIDRHYTVNIQRVDSFPYESEMLTQDGNIVSVKIQVQYRIADLKNYLFSVVAPVQTLHQAASSALRQVVGQMDLDPILTTGREELAQKVTDLLQQTLTAYHSGIEVREVTLQSSRPPEAVTVAFDDVIKATEDQKRYINQAEAYAKKRVLIAQGEVSRISQEAEAYRYAVVAQATGSTTRYLALLKPYQQAPGVTRERLYLDTVTDVLKHSNNILVDGGGNNVMYLPLDQLFNRSASAGDKMAAAAPAPSSQPDSAAPTAADAVTTAVTSSAQADTDNNNSTARPSYPAGGDSR